MTITKEELFREAINLSPMEKAQLVELILSSFNFTNRKEIDDAWSREAESRLRGVEAGEIQTLSMKEVFSALNL